MLKTGIFILALIYCTSCMAQCDSIKDFSAGRMNLKLAYISTIIYPGVTAGIEFPVNNINKTVFRNQKFVRCISKVRYISFNINWYHHPDFHDNAYLTAEWVMRRTRYTGFISEFSIGPGFSRTFLGGTTYRVDDNGNVSIVKFAGYNYALLTIGEGFGYDFSMKKEMPFAVFAKMNIISMFPYNSTIYFRPVLELGIRFTPGSLKNIFNEDPSVKSRY